MKKKRNSVLNALQNLKYFTQKTRHVGENIVENESIQVLTEFSQGNGKETRKNSKSFKQCF